MTGLETFETAILAKRVAGCAARALLLAAAVMTVGGCYPRHDWRDYRPDCAKTWCGFVATFPGRTLVATRDIPVASMRLPLTIHVATVDDVRFVVAAFELLPGADVRAARTLLEQKLLDDVGASAGRRGTATLRTGDGAESVDTFDAAGVQGRTTMRVSARFVERRGRLVELMVIGPSDRLASGSGRQAVETFLTSLRLD